MAIYGNMVVPSKAGGALPTDNSDRNVYVPGTEVSGRYSDAGGVLAAQAEQKGAEGLRDLGRGIGQLPGAFVAIYDRQRRLEMARAQEYVTQMQNSYINEQNYLSKLRGADAVGANGKPDVMAHYAKWRESAVSAMPKDLGEFGTRYAKLHLDTLLGRGEGWAQRYQDSQLDAYQESTAKAALQSAQDMMALSNGDPQQMAQAVGQGRAQIESMGQRLGWSQDVIDQRMKEFETKGVQGLLGSCLANGDLQGALQAMNQYGYRMGAQEFAAAQASLNQTWKQLFGEAARDGNAAKMQELMEWAKSAKLRKPEARATKHSLGSGSGAGAPVINGWSIGALSHKHESGGQNSRHISFGLWKTDGIDVGKYSFITGGNDAKVARTGGSVGSFIRWVRDKSPAGAKLYEATMAFTGGDWSRLNAPAPWKNGGAMQRAWLEAVDSGEIEALENRYTYEQMYLPAMRRLAAFGEAGRKTYELIMSDKTGALQSAAFSTIMQHKKSVQHLAASYDPDPATFLRKLGARRADPQWYGGTGMSNLGRNRQARETPDALYMLTHAGPLSQDGAPQPQPAQGSAQASGSGGNNIITAETLKSAEADYAPMALTSSAWNEISKLPTQGAREEAAVRFVQTIDNPTQAKIVRANLDEKLRLSKKAFEAQSARTQQEWIQKLNGMDSVDAAQTLHLAVDAGTISREDAALVHKAMFGEPVDDAKSRAALDRILEQIDNGEIVSKAQLETVCRAGMLTTAQTKDAIKFLDKGGSAGSVKLDVWKRCYFEGVKGQNRKDYKNKPLPSGLIEVASSFLPVGRIPTEDEVQDAVDKACTRDRSLIGSKMLYEYRQPDGTMKGEFSPEYTDEEYQQARSDAVVQFKTKSPSPRQVDAMLRRNKGLELRQINNRLGAK